MSDEPAFRKSYYILRDSLGKAYIFLHVIDIKAIRFTDRLGYLEFFDWCAAMNKTHRQAPCPQCRRFTVWLPRKGKDHSKAPIHGEITCGCLNCLGVVSGKRKRKTYKRQAST